MAEQEIFDLLKYGPGGKKQNKNVNDDYVPRRKATRLNRSPSLNQKDNNIESATKLVQSDQRNNSFVLN